jgi:hypothetical protein
MSALLKRHIIAMFVSENIVDAEISVPVRGPVNSNLRLFRLARTWRGDDLLDSAGHRGTWLFGRSRRIEIQFRDPCGSGHARLRHFRPDAGTCGVAEFFFSALLPHAAMMTSK